MGKTYYSFLGANTPQGFVSLFDELYNPYKPCRAFIVKGGPGTGKSTLMKKAGEKFESEGCDVEYVCCSSDPKSLDALIIPQKGICVADGTSPHTLEPVFPGAVENIINTGAFWNRDKLCENADEIRRLTLENSIYHRRSAKYLAAAGSVNDESLRLTSRYIDTGKIDGFALRFANRELPAKKLSQPGKKIKRFISAITPQGLVFLDKSITALASRVIAVDDEYTQASSILLDRIGETAIKNGYDVIFCHCPLKPKMQCEHIIIPEMRMALITLKSSHKTNLLCDRVIHARRFLYDDISLCMTSLRLNRRLIRELTREAVSALVKAKTTHDSLEKIYIEAMDFLALDRYCENILKSLL